MALVCLLMLLLAIVVMKLSGSKAEGGSKLAGDVASQEDKIRESKIQARKDLDAKQQEVFTQLLNRKRPVKSLVAFLLVFAFLIIGVTVFLCFGSPVGAALDETLFLNLFLGLTFLGWIIAIIYAAKEDTSTTK